MLKAEDCIGEAVEAKLKELQKGQVLLLENVRFHAEEEKNEPGFAKEVGGVWEEGGGGGFWFVPARHITRS